MNILSLCATLLWHTVHCHKGHKWLLGEVVRYMSHTTIISGITHFSIQNTWSGLSPLFNVSSYNQSKTTSRIEPGVGFSFHFIALTCLIMDVKALSLSFRVRISPDLPKQKPCEQFTERRDEHHSQVTCMCLYCNIFFGCICVWVSLVEALSYITLSAWDRTISGF